MITLAQMVEVFACPVERAAKFFPYLPLAAEEFGIRSREQTVLFLEQIRYFSNGLQQTLEKGSHDYLTQCYEGRRDLGNIVSSDGVRYCGRGLLPIRGRRAYLACSVELYNDVRFLYMPELLEQPENASRSAAWLWKRLGLVTMSDIDAARLRSEIGRRIESSAILPASTAACLAH